MVEYASRGGSNYNDPLFGYFAIIDIQKTQTNSIAVFRDYFILASNISSEEDYRKLENIHIEKAKQYDPKILTKYTKLKDVDSLLDGYARVIEYYVYANVNNQSP